jgi:hypothetical protein
MVACLESMSAVSKLRSGVAGITRDGLFGALSWPKPLLLGRQIEHHTALHGKRRGGQKGRSCRLG